MTGRVVQFPEGQRPARYVASTAEPATIIVLPVVRIERNPEDIDPSPPAPLSRRLRRLRRMARKAPAP